MQRFSRGLVVLACLFVSLVWSLPGAAAETPQVVAKVGQLTISAQDLNRAIQKILPLNVSFHGGLSQAKIDEIRQKALEDLVERALKVQYALAEELVVDNAEVEARYQKARARYQSEEGFRKALGSQSPATFRADIYRELLAEKAEQVAVDSKVTVSEEEIAAYYQQNRERFMRPRQYRASHILVKVDPASNQEERQELLKKAESLLEKAQAGEDFYNLAYYNSDDRSRFVGGDLGVFHEGQTVAEFDAALAEMKPGEIAGPVKTMYGYHIIKLDEVNEARQLTFEEMHDKIQKDLRDQEKGKIYEVWFEQLKQTYPVEYY